jgi:hypothetical protein
MKYVQNDFMMTAIDCVDMPSGPDCYVSPLTESVNWVQKNGVWVPVNEGQSIDEVDEQLFLERFETFIKGLKK